MPMIWALMSRVPAGVAVAAAARWLDDDDVCAGAAATEVGREAEEGACDAALATKGAALAGAAPACIVPAGVAVADTVPAGIAPTAIAPTGAAAAVALIGTAP